MAKTAGMKRKADAVTFEDNESDDASDTDIGRKEDDTDDDGADNGAAADDTTAKTPATKSTPQEAPGSSGGMNMRSGRKKKRVKRNSAADEDVAVEGSDSPSTVGTTSRKRAKQNGKANDKKNGEDKMTEDSSDEDEDMATTGMNDEKKSEEDVAMDNEDDNDDSASARKMPQETTQEAVAAAQATESTVEEGGDDDAEEEMNASSNGNGVGNSLVTQKLRLPSQHTPKPPQVATAATTAEPATPAPPPPGGRRLLFESAKKSSAAAGGMRNKLLMQTREQQQHTSTTAAELPPTEEERRSTQRHNFQQSASSDDTTDSTIAADSESTLSFFTELKEDAGLYTKGWFMFLLIFFVFGNLASVMSRDGSLASEGAWGLWNVRVQGEKLISWYDIEPQIDPQPADVITESTADIDDGHDGILVEDSPLTIIETVTVSDPTLLSNARAALRAHRMNLHDIQKLESSMDELQRGLDMLDSNMEVWRGVYPELDFDGEGGKGAEGDVGPTKKMVMENIVSRDVVIFSKSYCPHCKATNKLFQRIQAEFNANRANKDFHMKVIELDTLPDGGEEIQSVLLELTGQKTVPNVFVRGRHVGGNDVVQGMAKRGELQEMVKMDMMLELPLSQSNSVAEKGSEKKPSYDKIDSMKTSIAEKQNLLLEWEWALAEAEEVVDLLYQGAIDSKEVNEAVGALSKVSMMPATSAMVLDMDKITVPGEGCEGMDYVPLKPVEVEEEGEENDEVPPEEEETVEVVGGIDVTALDFASDAPVRLEDAQTAYKSLLKLARATSEALVGGAASDPSSHAKRWAKQIIQEELQKKGVDEKPPSLDELHEPIVTPEDITAMSSSAAAAAPSTTNQHAYYTVRDAVRDIDRLLEIEDADRTGKFDYASVIHGASVLRRGPYATSYSLYETLPLFNRVLAYVKLRFYGHPPEVALLPTFPMHARGQCWSFSNEFSSSRARSQIENDGIRGEYATLTVSLSSAITITNVVIEHISPNISSDPSTAIKKFRVVGFEDGGAFGEPWELGKFAFPIGPTLQDFSIPTVLDGQNVPKLKSVAIAVDSNWGAEYACLYRVRVHGA